MRKEIQDLKAASSTQRVPKAISGESGKKEELLLELRSDIQRLERDRDEVVQKATSQKELLARVRSVSHQAGHPVLSVIVLQLAEAPALLSCRACKSGTLVL